MKLIEFWYQDDYVEMDGRTDAPVMCGLFSSLEKLNEAIKKDNYSFRQPMEFKSLNDKFEHSIKNPKSYTGTDHYWVVETEIDKL